RSGSSAARSASATGSGPCSPGWRACSRPTSSRSEVSGESTRRSLWAILKQRSVPIQSEVQAPMAVNPEKEKAIELAMGAVERQFGKGSIMRLGKDEPLIRDIQVISTGSISLDIALGVGGGPRGRIVEIYGPESSGKTTLCLHVVAEAQKKGGICGYIDAEHAMDVGYARKLGVRTDDLLLSQPDTGEQALEIAEMLVRSGAIDVLVVDSVAALVPKA